MKLSNYFRRTVKILSIDGGGIRGYIPALILEDLVKRLIAKGKSKDLADHFDIIAGTSSGSLTALGLTAPAYNPEDTDTYSSIPGYSISDIVNMYEIRRHDIFPKISQSGFQTIRQAFHEKYDDTGFKKFWKTFLENGL